MKYISNKVIFDEGDLKILSRFKEMIKVSKEMEKLKEAHMRNKEAAYAEVKLFLSENNISWSDLEFDDLNNVVIVENKEKPPLDLFKQIFL